jgi:hypothetical protein
VPPKKQRSLLEPLAHSRRILPRKESICMKKEVKGIFSFHRSPFTGCTAALFL